MKRAGIEEPPHPLARLFRGSLPLLLVACASTGSPDTGEAGVEPMIPTSTWERIEDVQVSTDAEDRKPTRGGLLLELDQLVTAWNNQVLAASSDADPKKFRVLEAKLRHKAGRYTDELIEELQTGPSRNRQVAAVSLGFSAAPRGEGPLIAALEDPSPAVRANAALALSTRAALGDAGTGAETPLGGLLQLFDDPSPACRGNASLAVKDLVRAGARHPEVLPAARRGLFDEEVSVRVHSALILAMVGDQACMEDLAALLSENPLLLARAASRALATIGRRDPHNMGRAARLLAAALVPAEAPARRAMLLGDLQLLAGRNYGDETEPWLEWAGRLPIE